MLNVTFAANAISAEKAAELIKSGARTFIDEHNGQETEFEGVILMKNHKDEVTNICPMFINEAVYSLNPFTVREGKLYMSKWSCGGTLDFRGCAVESLAIDKYNKETILGGGTIEMVRLSAEEEVEEEKVLVIPHQTSECADFAHKTFISIFNHVEDVIGYDRGWENGTGYLDHAVKVQLPAGKMVKTIDPDDGRRIVMCGTRVGTVVVFERFVGRAPIVANFPRKLSAFLPTGVWAEEDVARNLSGGNIGESIEALFE